MQRRAAEESLTDHGKNNSNGRAHVGDAIRHKPGILGFLRQIGFMGATGGAAMANPFMKASIATANGPAAVSTPAPTATATRANSGTINTMARELELGAAATATRASGGTTNPMAEGPGKMPTATDLRETGPTAASVSAADDGPLYLQPRRPVDSNRVPTRLNVRMFCEVCTLEPGYRDGIDAVASRSKDRHLFHRLRVKNLEIATASPATTLQHLDFSTHHMVIIPLPAGIGVHSLDKNS